MDLGYAATAIPKLAGKKADQEGSLRSLPMRVATGWATRADICTVLFASPAAEGILAESRKKLREKRRKKESASRAG